MKKLKDQERTMKIYPKIRVLQKRTMLRDYYETAQIKIEGNYLVEAGFHPNSKINVQVTEGYILITKI